MYYKKNNRFDPSLEALTPEGVKFVLSPAGPAARALAFAADKIIQWVMLIIISVFNIFLEIFAGFWIYLILVFCIDWFYHVFFELSFRGQTPGKRLAGIRVIRSSGAPIDPGSSFMRNLLRFADTFLFLFPIALLSIAASKGFRRLGDWAGGTLVVYSQPGISSAGKLRSTASSTSFLENYKPVSPPAFLSSDEKHAIQNFARRYPLLGKSRAEEIASIYVPYLKENLLQACDGNDNVSVSDYLLGIARALELK